MNGARGASSSVVVPAVDSPHAVTFLRQLGCRGVRTIAAYERPTPAFSSRYCDETSIVPSPNTDMAGYRDALLSLVRRDDVHAIVPMREADVYVLAKHRSAFADAVTPLWPSFETLVTTHDRLRLVEAARDAGVPTPETRLLDEVDGWRAKKVVKSRYALLTDEYADAAPPGRAVEPSGVWFLDVGDEPDRDAIRKEMGHVPLAQEYVPGDEYAFWALYDRGEPVATCHKHQVRGLSYAGGTSVYRETVRIPALDSVGRALLDHLDWHGFASVQFKRDARTGEFTLLEVNPRVWVSVACPVRAGVDFPYYYWRLATGRSVDAPADYETGVGTHRLGGEAMHLWSVLRPADHFVDPPPVHAALREVASSLYRQPNFDYLSLDDPRSFVSDLTSKFGRRAGTRLGTIVDARKEVS